MAKFNVLLVSALLSVSGCYASHNVNVAPETDTVSVTSFSGETHFSTMDVTCETRDRWAPLTDYRITFPMGEVSFHENLAGINVEVTDSGTVQMEDGYVEGTEATLVEENCTVEYELSDSGALHGFARCSEPFATVVEFSFAHCD